jgi:DNA processing protein
VVVVEAAAKSGSLITARDALDQGREVMAVPGHPFDARAAGCNQLIRDGAALVRSAEDVLQAPARDRRARLPLPEMPKDMPAPPPERRTLPRPPPCTSEILDRLGPSPVAEDQLIRDLGAPAQRRAARSSSTSNSTGVSSGRRRASVPPADASPA